MVLDLTHMLTGCGPWPTFWTVMTGGRWPQGGCNMAAPPCVMTGVAESNQCDAALSNNQGFGLRFEQGTFGQRFNAKNGGWYAIRHTKGGISIWFWARDDSAVPEDVQKGIGSVQPENWGLPVADFPSNNCDMKSHFGPHEIVFDLTFCGVGPETSILTQVAPEPV